MNIFLPYHLVGILNLAHNMPVPGKPTRQVEMMAIHCGKEKHYGDK